MKKQMKEIADLQEQQKLHRMQLEENRKRALARKNQTKHLAALGVMVKDFLPDIEGRDEEEIRDILREKLLSN